METISFNTTELTLLILIGFLFLIQCFYQSCLYTRIRSHNQRAIRSKRTFQKELPPLSVIIYAHEDEANLHDNLLAILKQDYPCFEVIVINDGKENKNEECLLQLEASHPNLYHSFVPASSRYISRKKLAITLGIRASKYDWLVMTEASCRPSSDLWLCKLAQNFVPGTQIVLGYSQYRATKGWMGKQTAYDNLFAAMRYLGSAILGRPYMGIGRNMAYRKELFYQAKGFSAHLNLIRGDDDLFINQVATSKNTRVETDSAATVYVNPVKNKKEWREEKIGYASTARLYRGIQRYCWGLETFSRLVFYAVGILIVSMVVFCHCHWVLAGITGLLFILRYVQQAVAVNSTAKALGEARRYYYSLPLFDFLQPLQSLRWKLCCLFRKKEDFLRK